MSEVNPHYLDHVVASAATHEVEVTQDIVGRNGMKLLAKGARIDAEVRDRLLQHKLSRPLEDCVAVAGGVSGEQFSTDAQILACAEWLMGLTEAGASPVAHASVATKLMPGEFSDTLLEIVRAASRASDETSHLADEGRNLHEVLPRAIRVAEVLRRFTESRLLIRARFSDSNPELRAMLALCGQRMQQLQAAFSSAGLDLHGPQHVVDELAPQDPELEIEVVALVREFSWRMRELKRAALLRSGLMSAADQALVQQVIAQLEGVALSGDK